MSNNTVIIDYGMGNLHSVFRKLKHLNVDAVVSNDIKLISQAEKIVLPGVGHFAKAMENLNKLNLIEVLNEMVLVKKRPILGICLGMQIMANLSEEGFCDGLGWFDAEVVRFKHEKSSAYKNPHMGWNNVIVKKESQLMHDISEQDEFYFVHSYHLVVNNEADVLNETCYDYKFCSAIEKDNIFGVQYHPEKSHGAGEKLLRNFMMM